MGARRRARSGRDRRGSWRSPRPSSADPPGEQLVPRDAGITRTSTRTIADDRPTAASTRRACSKSKGIAGRRRPPRGLREGLCVPCHARGSRIGGAPLRRESDGHRTPGRATRPSRHRAALGFLRRAGSRSGVGGRGGGVTSFSVSSFMVALRRRDWRFPRRAGDLRGALARRRHGKRVGARGA
jgi:hypothetical protein